MGIILLVFMLTGFTHGVNLGLGLVSSDNVDDLSANKPDLANLLVLKVKHRNKRDTHSNNTHQGDTTTGGHGNAGGDHGNAASSHGNTTSNHDDTAGQHGNVSDHHDKASHDSEPHSIHVASWNFDPIQGPYLIGTFLFVAAMCKLVFHKMHWLSSFIPESCLLIVLGLIVGGILRVLNDDHYFFDFFTPNLFFYILLPPIILESAYSLHDRIFSQNLGTIILYAVVGTVLNCAIIGSLLYLLAYGNAMGHLTITPVECLVFSALIVAVDPVAVLAIFQDIGVNNVLYFLVFGESLFNDAVTVVLYKVMIAFNQMGSIPPTQILLGLAAFLCVSLGGLCIGIVLGLLTAFITKYTEHVRVVEPLVILVLAYLSYLSAEMFHFSGIIGIIGCGLVQAQYAFHNVSFKSETTVTYFVKMLSSSCDCIIFLFLGVALVKSDVWVAENWHTGFTLWALFLCIVVRFAVVYGLTYLANLLDRTRKIHWTEQFIMAYGGLRGAVAFSLVVMLQNVEHQGMFMTTTLVIIMFTVFIQGITMKPLVNLLRIRRKDDTVSICDEINEHVTDHVTSGIEEIIGQFGEHYARELLDHLDDKYLKVWFQKDPQSKDEYIMDLYQKIALQQHFENVAGSPDAVERYGSAMNLYEPEMNVAPRFLARRDGTAFHEVALDPEMMGRNLDMIARRHSTAVPPPAHLTGKRRSSSVPPDGPVDLEEHTPATGRRTSKVAKLFNRKDTDEEPEFVEKPTAGDVRKWMVKNPGNLMFHRKYDRNLAQEDKHDLLHHLYVKQLRNDRLIHHMGETFDTRRTPESTSARSSEFRSTEHIPGLRPDVLRGPGQVLQGSPDPRRLPPGERPRFRRGPVKYKTIDVVAHDSPKSWNENEKDGAQQKRPLKDAERTRLYRRSIPDEETILEGSEGSSSENEDSHLKSEDTLKAPLLRGQTIATPTIHIDDMEPGDTPQPTGSPIAQPELSTISEASDDIFTDSKGNQDDASPDSPKFPKGSRESLTLPSQPHSDTEAGYPDLAVDLSPRPGFQLSGSQDGDLDEVEEIPLMSVPDKTPEHEDSLDVPAESGSHSPGSGSRSSGSPSMHKIPSLKLLGKSQGLDQDR